MNTNLINLNKEFSTGYIIYTRKSTDDAHNQKNSIEYQKNEAGNYASREHLKIANASIEEFCKNGIVEEHHSGFKQDDDFEISSDGLITYKVLRPKFLTLVNLIKQKEFKGIICLCWDRLSRNESDDVLIKKLLNQGIDIRFVQANYDDTSAGALHMDIDGMFSRHYSRVISEKVKDSCKKLLAEGRCIYASPIGYLDQGSESKPFDPARAPIVKQVFELYSTGEWGFSSLARWANEQGLTTKPQRKHRTPKDKANGITVESMPKFPRPLTEKSVENILRNPFYIGKIINNDQLIQSKSHQPLIDTNLYYRVQAMLKSKTTSLHYTNYLTFTYRGLLKCDTCNRLYTPYEQKGIIYYRSKCKHGCSNKLKNINEDYINKKIKEVLSKIWFTDDELKAIELQANKDLNKITERRNGEMEGLYRLLNKAMEDMDYLIKDKLTLLRNGVFSADQIKTEESRLVLLIDDVKTKINANTESTKAILDYVLTFSELVKNASLYFPHALDSEKRELVSQVFSELSLENGNLKYQAKSGFDALLKRFDAQYSKSGSPNYVFSELLEIKTSVEKSIEYLKTFSNHLPYKMAA